MHAFRLRQKQTCLGTTFLRSDFNNSGPPAHASLLGPTHGGTAVLRLIARAMTRQAPDRAPDPVRAANHSPPRIPLPLPLIKITAPLNLAKTPSLPLLTP